MHRRVRKNNEEQFSNQIYNVLITGTVRREASPHQPEMCLSMGYPIWIEREIKVLLSN